MRYFYNLRYLVVLLSLLGTACGTALPSIKPYKLDVQQGNVVTSKMLLQLRPGMTKSQVRFIMGTPLIQDSFHGNRWDYVYQMREAGKITEQRRVILDFEKDLLKTVRGDVIPTGSIASEAEEKANTGTRVVEPYKKPEEKSLMNKLKFWGNDDAAPAKAPVEKEPAKTEPVKQEPETVPAEVPQPVGAADSDASPSMLAVPLEVPMTPIAPAVEVTVPNAIAAPVESAAEVGQVEVVPSTEANVKPQIEVAKEPSVEVVTPMEALSAVPSAAEQAVNAQSYAPESGMVFDRRLRSLPEEVEPEAVVEIPSTRVGNKTTPTPKDLPQENEPSFFDRMLEKIGF